MASHQNGQAYRGAYGNPHEHPEQQQLPARYNSYAPPRTNHPQTVRHAASFDVGDDAHQYSNQGGHYAAEGGYQTAMMPSEEMYMGHTPNAYQGGAGGYQYQSGPPLHSLPPLQPPPSQGLPSLPTAQSQYNPQEYARAQPQQYRPQIYTNSGPSYSNPSPSYQAGYQPYIPAAYQSTNAGTSPASQASPASYGSPATYYPSNQGPPVPPRPYETQYGNRRVNELGASSSPYSYGQPEPTYKPSPLLPALPQQGISPLQPRPSAYTPPAPPPPPFSPSHDAFPSTTPPTGPQGGYTYNTNSRPSLSQPNSRQSSFHQPSSASNQGYYSGHASHNSTSPRPLTGQSLPSPPGPTPPQHSPQRVNTIGRHPQARPLPGPPEEETDYFDSQNGSEYGAAGDIAGYDDMMREVEALVGRSSSNARQSPRAERINYQAPINEEEEPQPLFSASQTSIGPDANYTHTNGGSAADIIDIYSDESDAEAAAGLAAMRKAEEEEAAEEIRRQSRDQTLSYTQQEPNSSHPQENEISDPDIPIDMETFSGGFTERYHFHYGEQTPTNLNYAEEYGDPRTARLNSVEGSAGKFPETFLVDEVHPFPPFNARVDTGGTGGLSEPSNMPRRLSFEDGDESTLVDYDYGPSSSASSTSGHTHSGSHYSHTGRPLPRVPSSASENYAQQVGGYRQRQSERRYPTAPDEYEQGYSLAGLPVQKANSIGSHSATPHVLPPGRSATDAEKRRRHQSGLHDSLGYDQADVQKLANLDLPAIPPGRRKKFIPAKLSTGDYQKCPEPWALSSILAWIKEMTDGETDLRENAVADGIVALFTHKVPTMNTAEAEMLSARVVSIFFEFGALVKEEEWVKFTNGSVEGVLFQLTGMGCYSTRVHATALQGRCYSHHCMRTLRKVNLQTYTIEPAKKAEDWVTFYKDKLSKEKIDAADKKEVKRQNILHEIVTTEDSFIDQLNVLRLLYRDGLTKSSHHIIPPNQIHNFIRDVFGKVEAVKQVNEDYLLAQLKYRQEEQGPWIVGFSDIFREWIRKARQGYSEYAANFPNASRLVRREIERNILFRTFINQVREDKRSERLGWDTFLKAPITRLQRYSLLLSTVLKEMPTDSEERRSLVLAIDEVKEVTSECDARVDEMSKTAQLSELAQKLVLRGSMKDVQLNLTHLGRQVIFEGDLQRKGNNKVNWVETHGILFDHFLILAKQGRDHTGEQKYDVSKLPIPMDLLVLESTNDDPTVKSKGIASVSTVTRNPTPQERLGRTTSSQSAGLPLTHTQTNASTTSNGSTKSARPLITNTALESPNEKILYPFQIRHLGQPHVYVLYAPTAQNRQEWCDKIVEAKTKHAASLLAQNAEPFRLRILADAAFGNDTLSGSPKSSAIRGTPLDRAIREVEALFQGPRPTPVCRAQVHCAVAFNQPYGKPMVAVGTDYGVYLTEYSNPRGWSKATAIASARVTQIAVIEEFSLFLIISDKSLIAYHLDTICPATGTDSSHRPPQKLSGSRDVGFFATGRMKDRMLVFYKKKEGISSTFKVLEPVYQKSVTMSRRTFGIKKGTTDFFRDFDEFYIPTETFAINLFEKTLAVATTKGFEILTLDKKQPISVPDLSQANTANHAARIRDQRALGMFKVSDIEFLLVFQEVGIFLDKHGSVSRMLVMEFVGQAKQATIYKQYLILVDSSSGFVEVRNALNGRLRQVISGRDVRLLDDGAHGATVKICMQHPEIERSQIVVELILNEGLKELS